MTFFRPASALMIFATLSGLLFVLTAERPLPASEVDALAGGGALVDAIFDDERERGLREGFEVSDDHPRADTYPSRQSWRRHYATPPLARWSAGVAILLAPPGLHDRNATHLMACMLMALGAMWIAWMLGGNAGIAASMASLASSAAMDASGGASAGAISALAMTAFLAATLHMLSRRGSALWVGLSWGLLLAAHPGALFLLIPLFSAVAIAWRGAPIQGPQAVLSLPSIPLTLLMVPLVGVITLVMLWPTLWADTSRGLAQWLTDTWWATAPTQQIFGETLNPAKGRAPDAFIATLQWLAWTPWPIILAWLSGLIITIRQGRKGLWLPVLILLTVLIVGGVDGGLFGARRSLMPWLWVCTALTAGVGVAPLGRRLAPALPLMGIIIALLFEPLGTASLGPEARGVTPVDQLEHIAETSPGASVHLTSYSSGDRYAIQTLAWRADLDITWAEGAHADWVISVSKPPDKTWGLKSDMLMWEGRCAGLSIRRYHR